MPTLALMIYLYMMTTLLDVSLLVSNYLTVTTRFVLVYPLEMSIYEA